MKKYQIILGGIIIISGFIFFIKEGYNITGNVIASIENVKILIINFILIFAGLLLIIGGLEKKAEYDGVIVLGGNWRGYPGRLRPTRRKGYPFLDISLRSKMNCISAAEMYSSGNTKKIIIGTGKSAGKEWPSEAQAMKDFIMKKYPLIPEKDILTHEKTLDTYAEVEEDIRLGREYGLDNLALVTVNTQIPRVKKYLNSIGEPVEVISSEELFENKGTKYKKLASRYAHSPGVRYYESLKEIILRGLQKMGLTKTFTAPLAKLVRR